MILFIGGIDTGVGKTLTTGLLARWYFAKGFRVITHKIVQTGCNGMPDDIFAHRRLMGSQALPEDCKRLTCPYVFKFPASPHLAAALEKLRIDPRKIVASIHSLARRYDVVLVEGVGGLCVPLTRRFTTLDMLAERKWPTTLVTGPRLGSINHTLMALEALRARGIPAAGLAYNLHLSAEKEIVADSRRLFGERLRNLFPRAPIVDIPEIRQADSVIVDFDGFPLPPRRLTE